MTNLGEHDFRPVPGAAVRRCRFCDQPEMWGEKNCACPKAPQPEDEREPRTFAEKFDAALSVKGWNT